MCVITLACMGRIDMDQRPRRRIMHELPGMWTPDYLGKYPDEDMRGYEYDEHVDCVDSETHPEDV